MKRFASLLNRRSSSAGSESATGDSPEANVARGVRLFCESGGLNNSGEEVLHLPVIVDGAESSPAAAKEAANVIRKFLAKENLSRAYVQYNAIMLVRILADNPGESFTRNLGGKFVVTTKDLLKEGKDMSVQQILRETLDTFQLQKSQDEGLQPLITMWQNEKAKMAKKGGAYNPAVLPTSRPLNAPPFNPNHQQNYFARSHGSSRGLPPPHELASRIEEAKTSGKLLLQVVQSTPSTEILNNELLSEFSSRCQSASRSIQGYINATDPPPDEDTLLTLIETNDQLSMALSKYQRAMLQARKATGGTTPPPPVLPSQGPPPQTTFGSPPAKPNAPSYGSPPPIDNLGVGPPPGPPPRLAIPARQQQFENPFDDSNHAIGQPNVNGTSAPTAMQHPDGPQPGLYQAYKPTPSYIGRQESSTNNVTMHGAAMEEDDGNESPEEARRPVQYRF